MERLSVTDASFLYMENDTDLYYNAWLGIFEGPAPTTEQFRAHIASKLPQIPRYRQRVRFVPHDIAPPVWVDDQHFHLPYHVRHVALPAPGSQEQLQELFTTVMVDPLDRSKPLWDMWVVDGLQAGQWALISRLHHCMADGVSTTDITTTVLDPEPIVEIPAVADDWVPGPSPSDAQLVADALAEQQDSGAEQAEQYAQLMADLGAQQEVVDQGFAALRESLKDPLSVPSLNGPIGPYRRWSWVKVSLADVAGVRAAFGGTVNDVVLASVTRGFRDLLLSRGEEIEGRTVRCQVPVSVRSPGGSADGGNRVSAMYAELPVGIQDPAERLAAVSAQLNELKGSHQALAAEVLSSLAGFQPPALMAQAARHSTSGPNPVNTVATNVPGPQHPLYVLGRRMLDNYPYLPLASTMRIGTSIFSYDGFLRYGISADLDSVPDVGVLADGMAEGMSELVKAAARVAAAKPKPKTRRRAATARTATTKKPRPVEKETTP